MKGIMEVAKMESLEDLRDKRVGMPGDPVEAIIRCIDGSKEMLLKAGELLVAQLKVDPSIKRRIIERCPTISMKALNQLEKIGSHHIMPELAFTDNAGLLALARMPLSDQMQHQTEGIEVVIVETTDKSKTIFVMAQNMTTEQVRLAFARDHIRTPEEQRALIEGNKWKLAKPNHVTVDVDYVIHKNKFCVLRPHEFTKDELIKFASQL